MITKTIDCQWLGDIVVKIIRASFCERVWTLYKHARGLSALSVNLVKTDLLFITRKRYKVLAIHIQCSIIVVICHDVNSWKLREIDRLIVNDCLLVIWQTVNYTHLSYIITPWILFVNSNQFLRLRRTPKRSYRMNYLDLFSRNYLFDRSVITTIFKCYNQVQTLKFIPLLSQMFEKISWIQQICFEYTEFSQLSMCQI